MGTTLSVHGGRPVSSRVNLIGAINFSYLSITQLRFLLIASSCYIEITKADRRSVSFQEEQVMKVWSKPAVREQEVGLEVTSYLPAEIDII